jgi:predicted peroxiredoxin
MMNMTPKQTSDNASLLVIGTHSDDNLEKAMITFMSAAAASAIGVKTTVFLMSKGTDLVRKNFAKNMPKMVGMEPMEDLISTFQEIGGEIYVCIPCKDARGIKSTEFITGLKFGTLMDMVELTQNNTNVLSF